jgi:hypothetical protein
LLPRECKTANCFAVPEGTQNRSAPVTCPVADEHRVYLERAIFCCRAPARLPNRCHRAYRQRKPAHSKATPVRMEGLHSDQFLRAPHSQPDTTTSPGSNTQITTLRGLFLTGSFLAGIDFGSSGSSRASSIVDKITPPRQSGDLKICDSRSDAMLSH